MPNSFLHPLDERARQTGSLLCVGLDPHPADLPAPTAAGGRASFCLRLIEATADLAAGLQAQRRLFRSLRRRRAGSAGRGDRRRSRRASR